MLLVLAQGLLCAVVYGAGMYLFGRQEGLGVAVEKGVLFGALMTFAWSVLMGLTRFQARRTGGSRRIRRSR